MNGVVAVVGLIFTCAALSVATTALFELKHAEGEIATQPCSAEATGLAGCRTAAAAPLDALSMSFVVVTVAFNIGALLFEAPVFALIAAFCTTAFATHVAMYKSACSAVCAEVDCGPFVCLY